MNVVNTKEIWCRIVSDRYTKQCKKFYAKLNDVKEFVLAKDIDRDEFYIAKFNNDLQRVCVVELDQARKNALCFCVDTGASSLYDYNQLYICDKEFRQIPMQSVAFALQDLESFENREEISLCAKTMLQGKIFRFFVVTKQKEYDIKYQLEENPTIQGIFWDTSNSTHRNMNYEILCKVSGIF